MSSSVKTCTISKKSFLYLFPSPPLQISNLSKHFVLSYTAPFVLIMPVVPISLLINYYHSSNIPLTPKTTASSKPNPRQQDTPQIQQAANSSTQDLPPPPHPSKTNPHTCHHHLFKPYKIEFPLYYQGKSEGCCNNA